MKLVRRWLVYRRVLKELNEASPNVARDLGMAPKAVADFAWQCAGVEVDRAKRFAPAPASHHGASNLAPGKK